MTNVSKAYNVTKGILNYSKINVSFNIRQFRLVTNSASQSEANTSQKHSTRVVKFGRSATENKSTSFKIAEKRINNENVETSQYYIKSVDPDTFGFLSKSKHVEDHEGDVGDKIEEKHIENVPRFRSKVSMKPYGDMIKHYIEGKRFNDALAVLENKMLKEDRVKPEPYIYSLLISACGRFGYTKKAFKLYNQMKKRGLKVNDATYTGLFNACANGLSPQDGLKYATHLRELMIEKGVECNVTHYHSMIKAFGRCGDVTTAFLLVDEMIKNEITLTDATFNFLIQACIGDKEAGFRHALLVWHKMLQKKITPTVYSYNLILRCVRDCSIGDSQVAQDVLEQLSRIDDTSTLSLVSGNVLQSTDEKRLIHSDEGDALENCPNLLAAQPHLGSIISLDEVTKPRDRLLLLGGCSGVLQLMKSDGVTPNIKTFTLLLDSIPSTLSAENALLAAMKKHGIQLDIAFFNMLIKKRSMRFDYSKAREVLDLIQQDKLQPDIVTFGVLALGCRSEDEAKQLLWDMKVAGYRINVEILGAMLQQACAHHDFHYITKILHITKDEGVRPNAQFMEHLQNFNKSCLDILKNKDKLTNVPEMFQSDSFKKEFRKFNYRYKGLLQEIEQDMEDQHQQHRS